MPKNIDLNEIAAKNPGVNMHDLEEGRKLRQNLAQVSGEKRRHVAVLPEKRRVRIDDDISSDPRVIRLQRSSRGSR